MIRKLTLLVLILSLLAASCGGDEEGLFDTTPPSTVGATTTTAAPTTATPTTTTTTPATTTTTTPPAGGALVSIPVGPGGIEYRQGAEDLEGVGPSQLAVDPSGGIHIFDPVALRILSFTDEGESSIDLAALDILGVNGIAATAGHLIVVEIFFAPVRNLVHRVSFDGTLLETIDLAPGVRLEDGFSGVRAGPGDEIIIELIGGAAYGIWSGSGYEIVDSLVLGGMEVTAQTPDLVIGGNPITADLSGPLGSLRYLGTGADGAHSVIREDVLQTDPVFLVLSTVEWYTAEGAFLASARIPSLGEQAIDAPPGVALMPDGRAVALTAGDAAVEVRVLESIPDRILTLED